MSKTIKLDPEQAIPILDAIISGPRGATQLRLVFDTGAAMTQLDTAVAEQLGYVATAESRLVTLVGPAGDAQWGYTTVLRSLTALGTRLNELSAGVFYFDNFSHHDIDGLLGYDVIKPLRLEFDGPDAAVRLL